MFNQVILMGKLIGTPVFTTTKEGFIRCKFCLETNRPFKQKGSDEYGVDHIDVYVWEGIALTLKDTLKKGSIITVRGRLEQYDCIDPSSGETIHSVRVIGERVMYMSNKEKEEEEDELC